MLKPFAVLRRPIVAGNSKFQTELISKDFSFPQEEEISVKKKTKKQKNKKRKETGNSKIVHMEQFQLSSVVIAIQKVMIFDEKTAESQVLNKARVSRRGKNTM